MGQRKKSTQASRRAVGPGTRSSLSSTLVAFASIGAALGMVVVSPAPGAADAIPPEPDNCPYGFEGYSGHGGAGCMPPTPTDCPAGYVGQASQDRVYCAPPHATACPPGAYEAHADPDTPYCLLGPHCDDDARCGPGDSCRAAGICVAPTALPGGDPRFVDWRAQGPCETDDDCEAGQRCDTHPRCDADAHRVDPEGRSLPAIIRPLPQAPWQSGAFWACAGVCPLAVLGGVIALMARRRRA